ncbi:hypothetical protein IKG05_00105 [Candidatus Saccharibacteria bacterium]|nr:hypothetical protein [Candidatus Saccharibacteria bacterium]
MDYVFSFWFGVAIISIIGTLTHFLYDWTHQNRIIGLFTAVNESTWEHIKLALTATFLWSLYDGFFYGADPNYFLAKLVSLLVIIITIPVIFYSYRHFTKKSILPLDITLFYIAIILSQLSFYGILVAPNIPYFAQYLSCIGLFIFFGCYMTLTLEPLKTFLFKDPINGKYGFRAHGRLLKTLKSRHHSKKQK